MQESDRNQNAVSLLLEQHDEIRRLFDAVQASDADNRGTAFTMLARLLEAHEGAEAEVVYPSLRSLGGSPERVGRQRLAEEAQARVDMAELARIGSRCPDFEVAFKSFRSAVEGHAEREEAEVFPLLVQGFDEAQLQRMATALRTRGDLDAGDAS